MEIADARICEAFSNAVGDLYRVFARYPLRRDTEPCLHCVTEEEVARLHSRALHALDGGDLRPYAANALLTWGTLADFKHFLPRLLELMHHDAELRPWRDSIFDRLRDPAAWTTWPDREREAVKGYLIACWDRAVADPDGHLYFADVAECFDDLELLLGRWLRHPSRQALYLLADAIEYGHHLEPFRNGRHRATLHAWLVALATEAALRERSREWTHDLELSRRLTDAADWLCTVERHGST